LVLSSFVCGRASLRLLQISRRVGPSYLIVSKQKEHSEGQQLLYSLSSVYDSNCVRLTIILVPDKALLIPESTYKHFKVKGFDA